MGILQRISTSCMLVVLLTAASMHANVLRAAASMHAHAPTSEVASAPAIEIVPLHVSYKSYAMSSMDAVVIDSVYYVDIASLAEYVGGSATVLSDRVVFTLNGRSSHIITLSDQGVHTLDSVVYIRTAVVDSIADITISVDMLDLSMRIVSVRPLAVDLQRRQQLVRMQRRESGIDDDGDSANVFRASPTLLGGGHLFYRFSTQWSRYGQSSTVTLSPQLQIVGGLLTVDYERRFSDMGLTQQFASGQWAYQRPDLTWLTELSVGTTSTGGLSRGNWLSVRARNTSLSWKPNYGYDEMAVDLDGSWDADILLDGRVIAMAPAGRSTAYRVPLHGGQTTIVVDAYDAQGNNRTSEYRYRVHNESVPNESVWYDVTVARSLSSTNLEALANVGYGVAPWLTLGGLSRASLAANQWVPEVYAHARFARAQLVSLRYAPGQMGRVEMSFLPYNDASVDVSYSRWLTSNVDTLISRRPMFNGLRDELQANGFMPFTVATLPSYVAVAGWTRQGGEHNRVGGTLQFGTATSLVNMYGRFRYDLNNGRTSQFVELSAFVQIPVPEFAQSLIAGCALRATMDVGLHARNLSSHVLEVQASSVSFMDMQLLAAVRYNSMTRQIFSTVRLQALLPFVRADASTSMSGENRISDMSLSGSVVMSGSGRDLDFYQFQRSRSGSVNVVVFEDENENDRLDEGEPIVDGAMVRCVGGDVVRVPDGRVLVVNLFPNSEYSVVVDPSSLPDAELILNKPSYTVLVSPHQRVELAIPVQRGAAFEGSVITRKRVNVMLVNDNGHITTTSTFRDGSFTFGGVRPGSYELQAVVDNKRITSRIVIDKQRRLEGSTELRP